MNGRNKQCEFCIVNSESPPILGLSICENLGLITRGVKDVEAITTESINSTYKDVGNGLGCFEEPYHIVVEQDTVSASERTTSKGSIWATGQTETQTWSDGETQGHTEGQQTHRLGTQSCDCGEERRIIETLSRP